MMSEASSSGNNTAVKEEVVAIAQYTWSVDPRTVESEVHSPSFGTDGKHRFLLSLRRDTTRRVTNGDLSSYDEYDYRVSLWQKSAPPKLRPLSIRFRMCILNPCDYLKQHMKEFPLKNTQNLSNTNQSNEYQLPANWRSYRNSREELSIFCEVEMIRVKPKVKPINHLGGLSADLMHLFTTGDVADFKVLIGGGKVESGEKSGEDKEKKPLPQPLPLQSQRSFPVHRAILAARSPVLKAMLEDPQTEEANKSGQLVIKDTDPEVFHAFLDYLYTGRLDGLNLDQERADGLLVLADKYRVDKLKLACERKLMGDLTTESVAGLFLLADRHQAVELKQRCKEYINSHKVCVSKTEGWAQLLCTNQMDLIEYLWAED